MGWVVNVSPRSRLTPRENTTGTTVQKARSAGFITLMMEAVRTSQTSVYPNETTRRYIPEGSPL
jgi:hypothetical protein